MSERKIDAQPRTLDVANFTRNNGDLQGVWRLADMPRLVESLFQAPGDAVANWRAQGAQKPVTGGAPEVWLHLRGDARVVLQCQRCLQALEQQLVVDRRFRFVRDEAQALRLDEESDDDVMMLEPRMDLAELVEDEFILGLPIVPRHEICPSPLKASAVDQPTIEAAPNPFAVLAGLKARKATPGTE